MRRGRFAIIFLNVFPDLIKPRRKYAKEEIIIAEIHAPAEEFKSDKNFIKFSRGEPACIKKRMNRNEGKNPKTAEIIILTAKKFFLIKFFAFLSSLFFMKL